MSERTTKQTATTAVVSASDAKDALRAFASPDRATVSQGYFKTGRAGYAEDDKFIGASVPQLRSLVRTFERMPIAELKKLLPSDVHEDRLFALLVMVRQYARGDDGMRQRLYDFYLKSTKHINNWDLVDASAEHIVGAHLYERDHSVLEKLARSKTLWERRISIIATYHFIKKKSFETTLHIAEMLLGDREDLVHKAVGWMLREVGNRDRAVEEKFLRKHYKTMPRTMLRYAIEKFPEDLRQRYLEGEI